MAKLNTSTLVISVSQLLKDTDTEHVLLTQATIEQIEAVVAELVTQDAAGTPVIVEIQKAE